MQKEFQQNQGFNSVNHQVLYNQNPPLMYRSINTGPQPIRALGIPPPQRMPAYQQYVPQNNNFNQGQPNEMMGIPPFQVQPQFMPNGTPQYYSAQIRYPAQVYSVPVNPGQSHFQNQYQVPPQPQPNQQIYRPPQISHSQTPPQPTYIPTSQMPQMQQPQQPLAEIPPQSQQKKRTVIRLTDPNTGKDLTNEVFKQKEKQAAVGRPTGPTVIEDANAKFAAAVLQKVSQAPENKPEPKEITIKPPPEYLVKPEIKAPEVIDANLEVKENNQSNNETNQPIEESNLLTKENNQPLIENNEPIKSNNEPLAENNESIKENIEPIKENSHEIKENVSHIKDDNPPIIENSPPIKESTPPIIDKSDPIIEKSESQRKNIEEPISDIVKAEQIKSEPEQVQVEPENSKSVEFEPERLVPENVDTNLVKAATINETEVNVKPEPIEPINESNTVENVEQLVEKTESVPKNVKEESAVEVESKENVEIVVPEIKDTEADIQFINPIKTEDFTPEETIEVVEEEPVQAEPEFELEASDSVAPKNTAPTLPVEPDLPQEDIAKPGSAFNTVTKKKKGKQRFKDFDSKDRDNNDMLSAYKDAPEKEDIINEVKEVEKKDEVSLEETTWEDKEKIIEKEDIRNEDAEEPENVPKTAEAKIIKSEDQNQISNDDEKLQYDRDFLLKFQFAPICTSKPAGLPDIDIVLQEAHAPTKALVPGQRITASNDFMPTFLRSHSGGGGRSSGGGRSKDRRMIPAAKPPKIIQPPSFEKVELKKSENAWVRPSEKAKNMTDDEKATDDVKRGVCSILNKLTPQKFDELVAQMSQLKVNSVSKLTLTCDLIFEKAINEPNFCVSYAKMCRVLTDNFKVTVPQDDGKPPQVITFRKILLNKCQKEFEKENTDEKALELDRSKTFETEAERKAWKEELDFREMASRRRMLGNIRFIGELFKFKMISENIMHECVIKLLRSDKQEPPVEDNLECLCKLLATIGKDLDHKQAKRRIDQYFQQIRKITEKKKISSRIKFALQDVMDLRSNNWIPRRDDSNPKTIDQIHKEVEEKEREEEYLRQQDKLNKKLEPRGVRGGGRDSPVVRGGSGNSAMNDGWTNVPSKGGNKAIPSAPVDVNRFKIAKKDNTEISLGPGGRPGAWSRGASGGSSRSNSGSNTPTREIEQRGNRFDILTDSALTSNSFDNKRGRGSGGSRRGGQQPISQRKMEEKQSALRAVQDMTSGRNSRSQSPARPMSGASSGAQTPTEGTRSPSNTITEEKMSKVTTSTVEEYLSCRDLKEAVLCIKELDAPQLHHIFVQEALTVVIERKSTERRLVGSLFHELMKRSILTLSQICKGIESMVEFAPDFAVDIPLIYKYFGEIIGCVVYDGTLPLNKVKDTLEPLVQLSKAGIVMAEALSVAVQLAGSEDLISGLWTESNMNWEMVLNNNQNIEEFIKDKNVGFTKVRSQQNHSSQMQQELVRLLKERHENVNKNVISYIQEKVPTPNECTPQFIHDLTKLVCSSAVKDSKSGCSCDRDLLKRRKDILERFINSKKELELHALFALQKLATELNHPIDFLKALFEELYDNDVISEETYFIWEKSKEFPDGKGAAISSVKGFLSWLRKAEEVSIEEESSLSYISTSTNAAA